LLLVVVLAWSAVNVALSVASSENAPPIISEASLVLSECLYLPAAFHTSLCIILMWGVANNHYTVLASSAMAVLVNLIADLNVGAYLFYQALGDNGLKSVVCASGLSPNFCKLIKASGVLGVLYVIVEFVLLLVVFLAMQSARQSVTRPAESDSRAKLVGIFSLLSILGEVITMIAFFKLSKNSAEGIATWNLQFDSTFHLFAASVAVSFGYVFAPQSHPVLKQQIIFFLSALTALSWWGYFVYYAWLFTDHKDFMCANASDGTCHTYQAQVAGYGLMSLGQTVVAIVTASTMAKDTLADTGTAGQALIPSAQEA